MEDYTYDIKEFFWSKSTNTFYQDFRVLYSDNGHQYAFPNGRSQFYIKNHDTGGFRRFRLVEETGVDYIFESEDGIKCVICIDPDDYGMPECYEI